MTADLHRRMNLKSELNDSELLRLMLAGDEEAFALLYRRRQGGIYRFAAQMSGLPIVPVAFGAARRKNLRSWDRMIVPLPFTRAVFLYGDPIEVPRDVDVEAARLHLETVMNRLAERTENEFEQVWKEGKG